MDRVTLIALLFSALGCVSIDGGAVEASWVVVTHDGRVISECSCTCPSIAKIRLQLVPTVGGDDPCATRASCQFACDLQSGATLFDIPPGTYAISLLPVDADGNDIPAGGSGTCSAGPGADPRVREVVSGRVTGLDAMMVLADCAPECGGSDNTRVCAK
ncbi:MAG: hypothetical protein JXP73_05370 [Deltaproteobacteria bacterium]|jgi:hypothetical protein|nr:hypothetical protein [Deltaproteobacteria bacterium]